MPSSTATRDLCTLVASCSTHLPDLVASGLNLPPRICSKSSPRPCAASPGRPSSTPPWTHHVSLSGRRAACDPLGPTRPWPSSCRLGSTMLARRSNSRRIRVLFCVVMGDVPNSPPAKTSSIRVASASSCAASNLAQLSPSLRPWYSRCSRSPPDYGKTPPHLLERVPSLVLPPLRVALDVAVALGDVQPRLDLRDRVCTRQRIWPRKISRTTCSMSGLLEASTTMASPILDELFRERGGLPDQPFPLEEPASPGRRHPDRVPEEILDDSQLEEVQVVPVVHRPSPTSRRSSTSPASPGASSPT